MGDWFRNTRWDDEIAATFEARLSRARQKAGYLTIQGYTLLAHAPFVAAGLLRRAIAPVSYTHLTLPTSDLV